MGSCTDREPLVDRADLLLWMLSRLRRRRRSTCLWTPPGTAAGASQGRGKDQTGGPREEGGDHHAVRAGAGPEGRLALHVLLGPWVANPGEEKRKEEEQPAVRVPLVLCHGHLGIPLVGFFSSKDVQD